MQYRKNKKGEDISAIGYGCMRFSTKAGRIDVEKTEKEILAAVEAGVNYFDTAYIYPGSEAALGEIVERNALREKINIATKLPQYLISNRAAIDKYFTEELSRLRTNYVNYYLTCRSWNSDLKKLVKGFMIESYLVDGAQKVDGGVYGQSITDPCLGWEKSERLIYDIAEKA